MNYIVYSLINFMYTYEYFVYRKNYKKNFSKLIMRWNSYICNKFLILKENTELMKKFIIIMKIIITFYRNDIEKSKEFFILLIIYIISQLKIIDSRDNHRSLKDIYQWYILDIHI